MVSDRREFLSRALGGAVAFSFFPLAVEPRLAEADQRTGGVVIPPGAEPSVFSRMILGEVPCPKIYEDDLVFSFMARDEIRLGHTLVIPKIQIDKFWEVPEPYYTAVFTAAQRISRAILSATGCERVGTLVQGYEVPHFHYHLVPMFESSDLRDREPYRPTPEEIAPMQAKIIAALRMS